MSKNSVLPTTELEAMAHVAEECAEVAQAFNKSIRFGKTRHNTRKAVFSEIEDVERAIKNLRKILKKKMSYDPLRIANRCI